MRTILAIIVLAALGWAGYWFVGAGAARAGFAAWFDDRRAEGWVADYADLSVAGFPNRFDASFSDIALADPGTGLAWEAPFFQILALSYRPNHLIAVWPDTQLIATPLEKYRVESDGMRASLILEPELGLTVERAHFTSEGLRVTPEGESAPWRAAELRLAADRVPADARPDYHLGFLAEALTPPVEWLSRFDPERSLPDTFGVLRADLSVVFDKPWDRSAIEKARPQPRRIRLKLAEAMWGRLSLAAAGEVTIDEAGAPTGTITVKAKNWREMLTLARQSGALPETLAGPLEDGLTMLSRLAGNPKTLDIPLEFSGGRVWIGPAPIAAAPVLRIR